MSTEVDRLYNQETRIKLDALEKRFEAHKKEEKEMWSQVAQDLKEMNQMIQEVREDTLSKPTWGVTILITFLSSLVVGLLVALVK